MPRGVARVPEPWEWVRTKRCTRCEAVKPWALFSPRKYFEDGTIRYVATMCRECDKVGARVRSAAWRERNREWRRAYIREWERKQKEAIRADRNGYGGRLPAGPFLAWVNERLAEIGPTDDGRDPWGLLAAQFGVPDRSLRRVRTQEHVSLDVVDRALTNSGMHLYDLYPELQDESEAAA